MSVRKKLTGTHTIYAVPVFEDAKGKTGKTGKTAMIFLKGLLFSEGSTPVVDFSLDESLGSIAEMNGDSSHESECYGEVTVQVPEGYRSEYSDKTFESGTYELDYVRGRGNSTWYASKKPYKFKLMEKQDFFGMGKNKHWVLLANYYDYTMLRNKYTYWLGKEMGMEYTPECVFVDLVMNGEYLGSYYLCEQVRVGKTRVDIDDLAEAKHATDAETISGGYLLSMGDAEFEKREQLMVTTDHDYSFLLENPEFDTYFNESQYNYIKNYLNQMEGAIYGDDFKDENGVSYDEYIDVQAAIDYYLVQEFSLNGDGYLSGSTYLYKKRNGKLYWGPLWDFDYVAWGATETNGHSVDGFIHANRAPWMARLLQNENFKERLEKRWKELREILKASIKDGGQIDRYAKELYLSQKVNYQVSNALLSDSSRFMMWGAESDGDGVLRGEGAYDGYGAQEAAYEITFDNEVARLKRWISERIEWVDENIGDMSLSGNAGIRLLVDGELYAAVSLDREGYLSPYNLPADPAKDGYMFLGWYRTDEEGEEVRLKTGYYYEVSEEPLVYTAKWVKGTPEEIVQDLQFDRNVYYIPASEDEDDSWKLGLTIMPFELGTDDVVWSSEDESIVHIVENGYVSGTKQGETTITASYAGKTATCKVVVTSWEDIDGIRDFTVAPTLQVEKGAYAKLPVELTPVENVLYRNYYFRYIVKDPLLLELDKNGSGFVYGKSVGTTLVVVFNENIDKLEVCQVEIIDSKNPGAPATTKKASQAKLRVKKKTVQPGKSYTIQVQKKNGQQVVFSVSKKTKKKGITVTAKGKIKVNKRAKAGTYRIVVKVRENSVYKAKKLTFTVKVVKK